MLWDTFALRAAERRLSPSTNIWRMEVRFSIDSLFTLRILIDSDSKSSIMCSLRKIANSAKLKIMKDEHKTPGQLLKDLLAQRGWSKRVLSVVLGMNEATVNKLAADKQRFTAEISLDLEQVFGVSADAFLELQSSYDLAMARVKARPNPNQTMRANLFSALPVADMIKRGWIEAETVKDVEKVEAGLCAFFGVDEAREIEVLPHAARKTEVVSGTSPAQLAWLYRVKKIASEMIVPRYTPRAGREAAEALKPLRISAEATRKAPRVLAEAGIRFVVVEALPSSKIDGVCLWLDASTPVIGMSLRFDRIDNFWFVLRHELEHVLLEHGKASINIDSELTGEKAGTGIDVPDEERMANTAAAEFCVPKMQLDAFVARKAPIFSERDLIGFAKTLGVHPGLVVGQLQYRTERYNLFREHLEKVRGHACAAAMVDGWGNIAPTSP